MLSGNFNTMTERQQSYRRGSELQAFMPPAFRDRFQCLEFYRRIEIYKPFTLSCLDSVLANYFLSVLTICTLFINDIRLCAVQKEYDIAFGAITLILFVIFLIEILLNCWCREGYFEFDYNFLLNAGSFRGFFNFIFSTGSFYFYLDLMATFLLIVQVK